MEEIDWQQQYRLLEQTLAHIFISIEEAANTTKPAQDPQDLTVSIHDMSINLKADEATVVTSTSGPVAQYAFYVYENDARQHISPYSHSNTHSFAVTSGNRYRVRGFARESSRDSGKPVEATVRFEV